MLRTARILGTATLIAFLFRLSQQVSAAWGNEEVEGYAVALGVVSVLFFIRAVATEYTRQDIHPVQKDILWGITLGALVSMLSRFLR